MIAIRHDRGVQAATGAMALLVGVLGYALLRPPGGSYFLPAWAHLNLSLPWLPAVVVGSLPSFAHTLAFCLLTCAVLGAGRRAAAWVCLLWLAIEWLFEAIQHPSLGRPLEPFIPNWFDGLWGLEAMSGYLTHGTFSSADLLAAAVGAASAYLFISYLNPYRAHAQAGHTL